MYADGMSNTLTFDTLRCVQEVRKIKSLKLTQKEAEDFASAIEVAITQTVATKEDVGNVKNDLLLEIAKLESRMTNKMYTFGFAIILLIVGLYLK